jgi:hypothetical protein
MPSTKRLHGSFARVPPAAVVKMFLLASVSVAASGWALFRYYTYPRPPMVVPAVAVVDAGADAAEIPAPDLEVVR